jgi:hypothetical protein
MIRLRAEVGIENSGAAGRIALLARGFRGHIDGVDLCQHLRVVERERPAPFARIIVMQDAEAERGFLATCFFPPQMEGDVRQFDTIVLRRQEELDNL